MTSCSPLPYNLTEHQAARIAYTAIVTAIRDVRVGDKEAARWLLEEGYHFACLLTTKHIIEDAWVHWVNGGCAGRISTVKPLYITKPELLKKRGYRCECCGEPQTYLEAHHVFIHRSKRYPELDAPQNISLVCVKCHSSGRADTDEFFDRFWMVQEKRYDMQAWKQSLPLKVKFRYNPYPIPR